MVRSREPLHRNRNNTKRRVFAPQRCLQRDRQSRDAQPITRRFDSGDEPANALMKHYELGVDIETRTVEDVTVEEEFFDNV